MGFFFDIFKSFKNYSQGRKYTNIKNPEIFPDYIFTDNVYVLYFLQKLLLMV